MWLGQGIGPILSREEMFANTQCNLKSLCYFYVLQDVETLKQSHTRILGIWPYLFILYEELWKEYMKR